MQVHKNQSQIHTKQKQSNKSTSKTRSIILQPENCIRPIKIKSI